MAIFMMRQVSLATIVHQHLNQLAIRLSTMINVLLEGFVFNKLIQADTSTMGVRFLQMKTKKSLMQFLNVGLKPLGTSCISDNKNRLSDFSNRGT